MNKCNILYTEIETKQRIVKSALENDHLRPQHPDNLLKDPWLAASALQKAIRRSDLFSALLATSVLLDVQPDRFWRRLGVIALEDIGIADLVTATDILWVAGKRVWRQQNGGDFDIAAGLISRLCEGPKSRDACDILAIADWHACLDDQRRTWFRAPSEELAAAITDDTKSLTYRALAAWYLAGTRRLLSANLFIRDGRYKDLAAVYWRLGVPQEVLQITTWGAAKAREAHPASLPLIWLNAKGVQFTEREEEPPSLGQIYGWQSEAFDMHTRSGKRAFALLLHHCPSLRRFISQIAPNANPVNVVGSLVFRLEGSRVDRRLTYKGSQETLTGADRVMVTKNSISEDLIDEAYSEMQRHLPELHEARREVVGAKE
jgi:hypothetical protein